MMLLGTKETNRADLHKNFCYDHAEMRWLPTKRGDVPIFFFPREAGRKPEAYKGNFEVSEDTLVLSTRQVDAALAKCGKLNGQPVDDPYLVDHLDISKMKKVDESGDRIVGRLFEGGASMETPTKTIVALNYNDREEDAIRTVLKNLQEKINTMKTPSLFGKIARDLFDLKG